MNTLSRLIAAAMTGLVASTAAAQQTATTFTYQGVLNDNGTPVNGTVPMRFDLYKQAFGGLYPSSYGDTMDVAVTDGLFSVVLDFATDKLAGPENYLEIIIDPDGSPTILSPRQRIHSAPTAAQSAGAVVESDGDVTLIRDERFSTSTLIDNRNGPFHSSPATNEFWQSFTAPRSGQLVGGEFEVLRPPGFDSPPDWTLYEGEGTSGVVITTDRSYWVGQPGEIGTVNLLFPSDNIQLETGKTYTIAYPTSAIQWVMTTAQNDGVGPSFAGPGVAADFSVSIWDGYGDRVVWATSDGGLESQFLRLRDEDLSGDDEIWTVRPDYFGDVLRLNYQSSSVWTTDVVEVQGSAGRVRVSGQDLGVDGAEISNENLLIEDSDAVVGIYSDQGGTFGSAIVLGEMSGSSLVDKWTIQRRTSTFNNELQFSYGTSSDYGANLIRFALRPDGSAWLQGALQQNSSADQKHDVETLTDAIETLLQLRGVTYTWNDTNKPDIGFIAEEMAEVMPEIVGFDKAGKPIGIDYGRVTALIVEATKAQQQQLDEQAGLIEALTTRLEALEARD